MQCTLNAEVLGSNPSGATMTDKQILTAIEKYPDNMISSLEVICDIYSIDIVRAYTIVQNEHGPLYDNTPLLK